MEFYHRTASQAAILAEGFKDAKGTYMTTKSFTEVWFSDVILNSNEGAKGNAVFAVTISEKTFKKYEWVQEGLNYREALIPAKIVNGFNRRLLTDDEIEKLEQEQNQDHDRWK